jgi:heme a synthase
MPDARPHRLATWLFSVAALVFAIIIVGGITRLTESGLSITEWKPVSGALPPMGDAAWADAFAKYQQIPEYALTNKGMSLADFKFIFFWEWTHRLIGRLIGLALLLPLIWFAVRRQVPTGYGLRLFALAALVAFQGALGWWMVSSGLSVRTDVSHYRLAAHLLTALFLFAGLIWTALDLRALAKDAGAKPARLTGFSTCIAFILIIQLLYGAYTAGLNAGQVSNSWPLMNGHLLPEGIDWNNGVFAAFTNDPFLIHFIHRWWAWVAVAAFVMLGRRLKRIGARPQSFALHAAFGTQILLGIATVMTGVSLPIAIVHQAVGALVVASVTWGLYTLSPTRMSA